MLRRKVMWLSVVVLLWSSLLVAYDTANLLAAGAYPLQIAALACTCIVIGVAIVGLAITLTKEV